MSKYITVKPEITIPNSRQNLPINFPIEDKVITVINYGNVSRENATRILLETNGYIVSDIIANYC
jgi:hypothetical protein